MLRMLMFGKPGAGKGTLASRLAAKYNILTISSGDLVRQHITGRTDIGLQTEEKVSRGELLPDEVMLQVLATKLDTLYDKHWILDGFPRTIGQARLLDSHLRQKNTPLSLIVNVDVPDNIILRRISDRWVHLPSGRVYNTSYNPPIVDRHDDITGEPLIKRPDDDPEVIYRRLNNFYSSTSPLLAYYSEAAKPSVPQIGHPYQHPHQWSFHHSERKPKIWTLTGATSDDNWLQLDRLIRIAFSSLRENVDPKMI